MPIAENRNIARATALDLPCDIRNIAGMEPASTIITLCGGFDAVAQMTGRNPVQVRRWTYPRERGGTDGKIPTGVADVLLSEAKRQGVALTPAHFFSVANEGTSASPASAPKSEAAS